MRKKITKKRVEKKVARKKTILKEDILKTAYELTTEEGFNNLTARNIAQKMNCSTQPIYLEFANMEELKDAVIAEMEKHVYHAVLPRETTSTPLMDACVNYILFAKNKKKFFTTLYLEGEVDVQGLHRVSYKYFNEMFPKDELSARATKAQKEELFKTVWPFVYGTASLVAQDYLTFNKEMIVKSIESLIDSVLLDFVADQKKDA